jgi:isopropylmalate/homocitrate/citramalate synthase
MAFIQIYDTTLRDGTQGEGFTLSVYDKIRVAQRLDDLGVAFIEGGWPGSNPRDAEFFERARDLEWRTAAIAAFGSTCRVKGGPEDDANLQALLEARTPVCTIFGKTWTLHVTDVLQTTLDDNLRIIEQSVAYLRARAAGSSTTPSIFSTVTRRIRVTRWKRSRPPFAAGPRRSCCATPTAARCPGKWRKSSAR